MYVLLLNVFVTTICLLQLTLTSRFSILPPPRRLDIGAWEKHLAGEAGVIYSAGDLPNKTIPFGLDFTYTQ